MIDYDLVGHCIKCHKKIANFTERGTFDGFNEDAKDIYFVLSNQSKMHSKLCADCHENLSESDYPTIMSSVIKGWHEELARNGVTKFESDRYMSTYKEVSIVGIYNDTLIMGGATISLPNTFTAGTTIQSAQVNSNFTTIYNDYNGNITNANVASGAAIAASKLSLATIAQTLGMSGVADNWAQGADIASATSTPIGAATGNFIHVTGTTTITSFDTVQAGAWRGVEFTGILTLTYSATALILPTSANIITAVGDTAIFVSEGSGNWRCLAYQRRDGSSLLASVATQADMETATSTTAMVTPGRVQYHPGVSKAWCAFDGTAVGTNTPTVGYNVANVTRNGTGDYTINFTTAFSSGNFCVQANVLHATKKAMTTFSALTTGTARFTVTENAAGVFDGTQVYFCSFGDQ